MRSPFGQPDRDDVSREILSYLTEHPDAEDTLEGIARWWLLERELQIHVKLVEDVLRDLTRQARIRKVDRNGTVYYRAMQEKPNARGGAR